MRAELEREPTLEPRRLARALLVELPVPRERRHRLLAELEVVVRVAETAPPPRRLEELHQRVERAPARGVEALEHLVYDDPEALVDRRLLRDPEDARELVLQRAETVGLDVGRGQHHAVATARDESLERLLVIAGDRTCAPARVGLLVTQILVE